MGFVQSPLWGRFYFWAPLNPYIPHLHSAFCQHCTPWKTPWKNKAKQTPKLEAVRLRISKATTEITKKFRFLSAFASAAIRFNKKISCGQSQGLWEGPFCKNFLGKKNKTKKTSLLCSLLPSTLLRLSLSILLAIVALPSCSCLLLTVSRKKSVHV